MGRYSHSFRNPSRRPGLFFIVEAGAGDALAQGGAIDVKHLHGGGRLMLFLMVRAGASGSFYHPDLVTTAVRRLFASLPVQMKGDSEAGARAYRHYLVEQRRRIDHRIASRQLVEVVAIFAKFKRAALVIVVQHD